MFSHKAVITQTRVVKDMLKNHPWPLSSMETKCQEIKKRGAGALGFSCSARVHLVQTALILLGSGMYMRTDFCNQGN